jgi:hypothetical protein
MMRPFFPFYGSKWNIARYYPAPAHDVVVEPFAGGAGYATFHGCKKVHLIDADPIIVGVWSYLMKATPDEIMALPELPNVGDNVDDYALPQEAKWLIGFWLNRGSATPKKSRTAYSARTDRSQLNWGQKAKQRIASQLSGIAGWSITEGQYHGAPEIEATWFIDPPYGDKGRYYRVQFADFANLAPFCRARRGLVIACEGPEATWLPFEPLGEFKSSSGKARETVYIAGEVMRQSALALGDKP